MSFVEQISLRTESGVPVTQFFSNFKNYLAFERSYWEGRDKRIKVFSFNDNSEVKMEFIQVITGLKKKKIVYYLKEWIFSQKFGLFTVACENISFFTVAIYGGKDRAAATIVPTS